MKKAPFVIQNRKKMQREKIAFIDILKSNEPELEKAYESLAKLYLEEKKNEEI